jgi:hypothetical protein
MGAIPSRHDLHWHEAAHPNIHRVRVCFPIHHIEKTAPHLASLADVTSDQQRRSSRPRTPSSRRPPDERDGERVG